MQIIKKEKIKLDEVIKALKKKKVVVFPTDTVYGLIADATSKIAVEKVFKIKKREKTKPLPIFVKDLRMAKTLAKIDKKQERIIKSFWPGRVTAVLERKAKIKVYGLDKRTIALRIPKYKLINILLDKLNLPLTGTSANVSGKPSSTKIKEIISQFKNQKNQPDLVIDAGDLKPSKPSTILDLKVLPPKILRR